MTDGSLLTAICKNCGHRWFPYGNALMVVPHTDDIKCPNCGNESKAEWLDEETKKLLYQREKGLIPNVMEIDALRNEIQALKNKVEILEQSQKVQNEEIELQNKKSAQMETITESISKWAKKREQDFLDIESIAEDLKEEEKEKEKFRNDNQ